MTQNASILLVDDDRFWVQVFAEHLRMEGFKVKTASSVKEAKRLIEDAPPDLAVLDVMLPAQSEDDDSLEFETHGGFRSGMALAQWIKEHYP